MKTNWESIGKEVGSIAEGSERGGTDYAQKALEKILGEEWIRQAVETAISSKPGAELAMNCLRHISSELAAEYAYSIYKSDASLENRRMAVWLLKHLSVKISYGWVEEFLRDQTVIGWGLGVLDQLLWKKVIHYKAEKEQVDFLLNLAMENSGGVLKEQVEFIRGYLK